MEKTVNKLYQEIADNLNITVSEVVQRTTKGEKLIQSFYEWKYNWDPNNEKSIYF
jgi:hypothetical protein